MVEPGKESTTDKKNSFSQSVVALPGQYVHVLTHPSIQTFREEKDRGGWGIIWLQMLLLGAISALLTVLIYTITPVDVTSLTRASSMSVQDAHMIIDIIVAGVTFMLIPISFLFSGVILYLIARALGGKGIYREQLYVTLLFGVPLVLLSDLLGLIPATTGWLPLVPHIYSVVLMILALIAIHRSTVKYQ